MNHAQLWYFSRCDMAFLPRLHSKASFMPGDTNWPYCYDSGSRLQATFSKYDRPT